MTTDQLIDQAFELALQRYADLVVDAKEALRGLTEVSISMHCWQGDDVVGFEDSGAQLGSGLAVTGKYPGRARTPDELRRDLEMAYSLIPGTHRLNLHALYGEFPGPVDRDEIGVEHFQGWIDWAGGQGVTLDFNPSFFSHKKADDGFTLSHSDAGIRQFWIDHGIASRRIAAAMGAAQGNPCVNNIWVPDGSNRCLAPSKPKDIEMNSVAKIVSLISLCFVVIPCLLYFAGAISLDTVKLAALVGTIGWFIATPVWMSRKLPIDAKEVEI